MSTKNYVQEIEYGLANGVDNTSPTSMIPPGYVRKAKNCNLGLTGGYTKRKGYTEALITPWGTRNIDYGTQYKSSAGITETLVFGSGSFGKLSGGGVTTILTSLSSAHRVTTVQFEDRLYAFNGDSTTTPFVYSGGTIVRDSGVDGPVVAPVTVGAAGGSLTPGNYVVGYTYIIKDNVSGRVVVESGLSPLTSITLVGPNASFNVNVVASAVTPLTNETVFVRIYRTVASGSVLFLAKDLVVNTTHTENTGDSDATVTIRVQGSIDQYPLDAFDGYNKARFPITARNRIFVAHSSRSELRFSKLGQEGPLPENFTAIGFAPLEGRLGSFDTLVGMGQINDIPIILKTQSIGTLEEVGLPEITRAEDPVTYVYRELSDSIGAVSNWGHIQVLNELVFLSKDNIYATDGRVIRPIANSIKTQINSLGFNSSSQVPKISIGNDVVNRRIIISVFETTLSGSPKIQLIGDYQQYPAFRWSTYEPGIDPVTHPGITAGSFFNITNATSGLQELHFGNLSANGQLYKMNNGDSDNTFPISFKVITRPYDIQHPMITKLYKNIRTFAEATDDTYEVELCVYIDLNERVEIFCQDFVVPGAGNNWNEHNWAPDADPLIWGGPALAELTYNPHIKAKFLQIVYNQNDADAPVSLLGWGVSGSIFGGL